MATMPSKKRYFTITINKHNIHWDLFKLQFTSKIMKKTIITITIVFITGIIIMAFSELNQCTRMSKNASGARVGYSGDPAVGGRNCTSCHDESPNPENKIGWIVTDIPTTGYIPKTTYKITTTAVGTGHSVFGFEMTPQNSKGTFLGTWTVINSETKLTTNPNYITQTSEGTLGTGSKTWTFNWTAPAEGSGAVTFYAAYNLANGNSSTSGDTIKLSTLTVNEKGSNAVDEIDVMSTNIRVYPNPATDVITLKSNGDAKSYLITDESGKTMMRGDLIDEKTSLTISHFNPGVYFIQTGTGGHSKAIKLIKK